MDKLINIPPAITKIIVRDLGKFGGHSGVNKLFYLMSVVDNLISFIGWDVFIREVKKELERLKKFEEETKEPTIYSKIKDWKNIKKSLDDLRPRLNEIQMFYDDIRDKERRNKLETEKKWDYIRLSKRISPYQLELYFVFSLLMKITSIQRLTIPTEAFKTQEMDRYTKSTFIKQPKSTESHSEEKNENN